MANRTGLPLGLVVGLNILYDITAFDRKQYAGNPCGTRKESYSILNEGCTSLLACDGEGRIWHGRNLDYDMGELLKKVFFEYACLSLTDCADYRNRRLLSRRDPRLLGHDFHAVCWTADGTETGRLLAHAQCTMSVNGVSR